MTALVQERSRRHKDKSKSFGAGSQSVLSSKQSRSGASQPGFGGDISSLVESVKRRSVLDGGKHQAKRRKL